MKNTMHSLLSTCTSSVHLLALSAALTACSTPDLKRSTESDGLYAPQEFGRGAERGPSIDTLHSVAKVMAAQGRDGECGIVLQKLIDTHPRFLPAYNEMAELSMRQDDLEGARAALEAGLEVAPKDDVLLNNLGMLLFVQSEYDLALESFTEASAVDPTNARCRANMAASLGMLGRFDEALAVYYLIAPPSEAHHNLGVLCQAIGNEARAEHEFALARKSKY